MRFERGQARLGFAGRAELARVESDCLAGNPLGDPTLRELPIYLPPGAEESGAELPLILVLSGFTGRGHKLLEPHPWFESVAQRYDRAVAAGDVAPAILAFPDAFTALGGSQYVNSSATGRYEDHVAEELIPLLEEHLPIARGRRAVCGKSSGGFGALHLAMHRPGLFQAVASISGDCDFELCFGTEILGALRGLVPFDMDPARFLEAFRRAPKLDADGHAVINVLAMSACYSPNPESALGFDLPMELECGRRLPEVWNRWLAFDPLEACAEHRDALAGLELLHLECGLRDEFHLQWGLRRLVERLRELDVAHTHLEHPGGHRGIDERYELVLPRLAEVLGG